jgi:D-psicose/D-tagatose/L-ribulose 3-epimerase
MNKLGIHAFVWTGRWDRDGAAKSIGKSADLGFDHIEIPGLDPHSIDVKHTRKCLEDAGMSATMSLGLDAETDISSGDPDMLKRGEARLMEALAAAQEIGATHVCGILYSAFQKYMHPVTSDGLNSAVDVLQRVCEEAQKSDITIGLEVVNRYETNVLNTAAQAIEMCDRIGAPNVKVHLDTYHMHIEEADPGQSIRRTADYLGYFHVGESHRGYLGSGSVDFTETFRSLAEIGYQGPIAFESFSSAVSGPPLSDILGVWRNLWDDSEDLARHAAEFIRAGLKAAAETQAVRAGFENQETN